MDNKKKNDRRISIVLNGKQKPYDELAKDELTYSEFLNQENSATKEDESEEFQWVLSEEMKEAASKKIVDLGERRRDKKKLSAPYWDDGKSEDSPKIPYTKRKKKRRLQFDFKSLPLGLIGIIASAIVVGVSFGLMMLTIFTGEKAQGTVDTPIETPQAIAPVTTSNGQVPTLGIEIIQGGAFSIYAKGEEIAQGLKNNGFASVVTKETEPAYLFIGLGLNKEQANAVADIYKASGQDIYLKPYAVASQATIESEEQLNFLQTAVDFYQQLTLLSVNGLTNGGSLVTDETFQTLASSKNELALLTNGFAEESRQAIATSFQTELTMALTTIENFSSTNDRSLLWQTQQHLLNGLLLYEELVNLY